MTLVGLSSSADETKDEKLGKGKLRTVRVRASTLRARQLPATSDLDRGDERPAPAPRLEVRARGRRGALHRQPAVLPPLDRAGQPPAAQAAHLPHHRLPSRVPHRRARPATALAAAFPLLDAFSASPGPPIRGPRRGPAATAARDRHPGRAHRAAPRRSARRDLRPRPNRSSCRSRCAARSCCSTRATSASRTTTRRSSRATSGITASGAARSSSG